MEPPAYKYLSTATRMMDMTKLNTLGAYARAMLELLGYGLYAERKREANMR